MKVLLSQHQLSYLLKENIILEARTADKESGWKMDVEDCSDILERTDKRFLALLISKDKNVFLKLLDKIHKTEGLFNLVLKPLELIASFFGRISVVLSTGFNPLLWDAVVKVFKIIEFGMIPPLSGLCKAFVKVSKVVGDLISGSVSSSSSSSEKHKDYMEMLINSLINKFDLKEDIDKLKASSVANVISDSQNALVYMLVFMPSTAKKYIKGRGRTVNSEKSLIKDKIDKLKIRQSFAQTIDDFADCGLATVFKERKIKKIFSENDPEDSFNNSYDFSQNLLLGFEQIERGGILS